MAVEEAFRPLIRLVNLGGMVAIYDEIGRHLNGLDDEARKKVAAKLSDITILNSEIRKVRFTLTGLENQQTALLDEVDHLLGRW